ncbi:hypothetical protein MWU59_02180 [Flavobacteriaceae bacterium F08102]|nr:hypothetical protein [Flavobacteriaceae bacterium F08102]
MTLSAPLKGKLITKPNEKIQFRLENVPKDLRLFYAYNGDKFSQEINRVYQGKTCSFEIPFPRETNSVLYIVASQNVILTFRANVKQ